MPVNFCSDNREEPASAGAVGCDEANEWFEGAGDAVFDACDDVVFDGSVPVNFGGDDGEEPASAGAVGCDEANEWFEGAGDAVFDACVVFDGSVPVRCCGFNEEDTWWLSSGRVWFKSVFDDHGDEGIDGSG